MGATPVPGPTHKIGVEGSSGRRIMPFWKPTCTRAPDVIRAFRGQPGTQMQPSRTERQPREIARAHASPRRQEPRLVLHDRDAQLHLPRMTLRTVSETGRRRGGARTASELAMENMRGRMGGKMSKMYSRGTRTLANSARTSPLVRRTRFTYSYMSSCAQVSGCSVRAPCDAPAPRLYRTRRASRGVARRA